MLRHVAQWLDVPLEAVQALPALTLEMFIEGIGAADPAVVQDRKRV